MLLKRLALAAKTTGSMARTPVPSELDRALGRPGVLVIGGTPVLKISEGSLAASPLANPPIWQASGASIIRPGDRAQLNVPCIVLHIGSVAFFLALARLCRFESV